MPNGDDGGLRNLTEDRPDPLRLHVPRSGPAPAPVPGKKKSGKGQPAPVRLDRQALASELRGLFARNLVRDRAKSGTSGKPASPDAPCASC